MGECFQQMDNVETEGDSCGLSHDKQGQGDL